MTELDEFIAKDIRVRCPSLFISLDKHRKNFIPVFFDEIFADDGKVKLKSCFNCIIIIELLGAFASHKGRIAFDVIICDTIPVSPETASNIIALLFKKIGCYCGVDSA